MVSILLFIYFLGVGSGEGECVSHERSLVYLGHGFLLLG